jgi:hypothetical protein
LYYLPAWELVPAGGFTQTLFTIPDQHPLAMQPSYKQLTEAAYPDVVWNLFVTSPEASISAAKKREAMKAVSAYDYLVFFDTAPFDVKPTNLLELVREGPSLRIYRVRAHALASVAPERDPKLQSP